MSILDRVTKAVGDVVDRGKKEVDQFVRIQKINAQISDVERTISDSRAQIQQTTLKIGEMAVGMLRAGKMASPEMQALLEDITGTERFINSAEAEIAGKRAEIDKIKAEDSAEKDPAEPSAEPAPPSQTQTAPAARFCAQCGAPAGGSGAFCSQCGSKLG